MTLKMQINKSLGDKEIYNLFHDRSPLLLEGSGLIQIESVYALAKYESPQTTWAHVPSSEEKITVLFPVFQQPYFSNFKYLAPFKRMEYDDAQLNVRFEPFYRDL